MAKDKPIEEEERAEDDLPLPLDEESPKEPPAEAAGPMELPEPVIEAPEPLDLPVGVQNKLPGDTEPELAYSERKKLPEDAEPFALPPLPEAAREVLERSEILPEPPPPLPEPPEPTIEPPTAPEKPAERLPQELLEEPSGREAEPPPLSRAVPGYEAGTYTEPGTPGEDLSLKGRYAAREAAAEPPTAESPAAEAAGGGDVTAAVAEGNELTKQLVESMKTLVAKATEVTTKLDAIQDALAEMNPNTLT